MQSLQAEKSFKIYVKKSFKKSVQKICQKIFQKINPKNISKNLSKNMSKNLPKNSLKDTWRGNKICTPFTTQLCSKGGANFITALKNSV